MDPIRRPSDESVFHGVVVDVIHVLGEVVFIPDRVLPEAALPQTASYQSLSLPTNRVQ